MAEQMRQNPDGGRSGGLELFDGALEKGTWIEAAGTCYPLSATAWYVLGGVDETAANDLVGRALGTRCSRHPGARQFVDLFGTFQPTAIGGLRAAQEAATSIVMNSAARLGSISLDGFLLTFGNDGVSSFWIETHEDVRRRVLAGEATEGVEFAGVFDGFVFVPRDIAKAVVDQY